MPEKKTKKWIPLSLLRPFIWDEISLGYSSAASDWDFEPFEENSFRPFSSVKKCGNINRYSNNININGHFTK